MPAGRRAAGRLASRSSDHRNAASVLPEPVGRDDQGVPAALIAARRPACAAVGAAKAPSNHARVAGENAASAPDGSGGVLWVGI